jgi:hypothetical protein
MFPAMIRPACVVAAVTAAIWLPSLGGGFVYDSVVQIESDDYIHTRSNVWPVVTLQVMGRDVLDFNRPIMLLSLMVDSFVWGREPFGYRLTNWLLHVVNSVLLFLLLRRVLGCQNARVQRGIQREELLKSAAVFGALFFALHPLCAEVICEPANREDLLVSVFAMAALLLAATGSDWPGPTVKTVCAALCVLCVAMGIGSKETGVCIPFLLAAFWLFVKQGKRLRWWLPLTGASFAVAGALLVARFWLEPKESVIFFAPPQRIGGTIWEILPGTARILVTYLGNVFWPTRLLADYTPSSLVPLGAALAATVLGALLVGALFWCLQETRAAFLLCGIALSLLPVLNFVPIYRPAADRYLYLPLMFGGGLGAIALGTLATHVPRCAAWVVATAVSLALTLLSIRQQSFWDNRLALWSREHHLNPGSYTAHTALASALAEQAGRHEDALTVLRQAEVRFDVAKLPGFWALRARVCDALGRYAEADEAARVALAIEPRYASAEWTVRALRQTRREALEFERIATRSAAKLGTSD